MAVFPNLFSNSNCTYDRSSPALPVLSEMMIFLIIPIHTILA